MNILQRFFDLIPKEPEFVGVIQYEQHPHYKVLLVDGSGLVACTASGQFNLGARVVVQGLKIVRTAPFGDVIQVEV